MDRHGAIHMMLSVVHGLIIGAIVHRMGKLAALATGAVFGLVVVYVGLRDRRA